MRAHSHRTFPRRVVVAACCATLIPLLGACSSQRGYHGAALIDSVPTGAEVVDMDNDAVLGTTPVRVWWRRDENQRKLVNVRLEKDGYPDKTVAFWVTLRHKSRDKAENDPQQVTVNLNRGSD